MKEISRCNILDYEGGGRAVKVVRYLRSIIYAETGVTWVGEEYLGREITCALSPMRSWYFLGTKDSFRYK